VSVCPSAGVCHTLTASKRRKLGPRNIHHQLRKDSTFRVRNAFPEFLNLWALNKRQLGKIGDFQLIVSVSQKRCEIELRLLLITNRRSQNQRPWMTLNAIYALYCTLLSRKLEKWRTIKKHCIHQLLPPAKILPIKLRQSYVEALCALP